MKNLNINNSNTFRNFALVIGFILVSFNLSAQYAPLALSSSFVDGNTNSKPSSGLDLWYDFGWRRSASQVSFDNTSKSITITGAGNNTGNRRSVTTIDFEITNSTTEINLTYTFSGSGGFTESLVIIRRLNDNSETSINLTNGTSTNLNLYSNSLTNGNYVIEFRVSASSSRSLIIGNFSTDATPSILPVTYSALSAKQILGSVQVSWTTSMEENNSHFDIERSVDGSNWEMIGSENGVGFSTEEVSYTFTDYSPAQGTNIYRLKQVDFDGQYSYSKVMVVLVNNGMAEETIQLFPNPSKGIVNIKGIESPKVTVFNTAGTALYVSQNQTTLNLDFLQLGVYFLQIESQDGTVTKHRFLKD